MPDDSWIEELRAAIESENPGVSLWIHAADTYLIPARLIVPEGERNRGIGTAIMHRILAEADRRGVPTALTPSNAYGGAVTRLRPFYRRFGFVPNRGRARDFATAEAMVRAPKPEGIK
ncbi:GNAT family N-acetyltransferase [Nocardia terpenica]|uniref:N-acetyltransferase domain-containing protein n=1 Tax=Nocardia terpenica TaxID=455432 RepID=A0A164LC35_9NOCA|nr:GNAT family N-acetyltransferase [Nocardia terpenica]KZM72243.1 hypothetical protein AWN90_36830 [Nocardia terpenica]NQE86611.1 GNAT family N-acetyltransferase [Nocardia terpenica]